MRFYDNQPQIGLCGEYDGMCRTHIPVFIAGQGDMRQFAQWVIRTCNAYENNEMRLALESGGEMLKISVGDLTFSAEYEAGASQTVAAFDLVLPFRQKIIQARWSGESAWVPLGDYELGVGVENATSYPSPGEILFYPGGFSETEILFPYGRTCFASTMGQLAGNHFLTIVEGKELLKEVGRRVVWEGAQEILFERIDG